MGFQQSGQSHFVTFTCYHRQRGFDSPAVYDLFLQALEQMRQRIALCVYGYVVMPEHVHLLLSEPHYALREKGVVEIESEWTARDRERHAAGSSKRTFLIPG